MINARLVMESLDKARLPVSTVPVQGRFVLFQITTRSSSEREASFILWDK
jgi:hypothetical protein